MAGSSVVVNAYVAHIRELESKLAVQATKHRANTHELGKSYDRTLRAALGSRRHPLLTPSERSTMDIYVVQQPAKGGG